MGLGLIKSVVKVVVVGIILNFAHGVPLVETEVKSQEDEKALIADDVDNNLSSFEGRQFPVPQFPNPFFQWPMPWNSCVPDSSLMHNVPGASMFYQSCTPPTTCVPLTATTSPSMILMGYGLLGTCRYKESDSSLRESEDAMQAAMKSLLISDADYNDDAKNEAAALITI